MSEALLIATIPSVFTLIGVIVTVVYGNKKTEKQVKAQMQTQTDLTIYRIDQLEKKVEKHNSVIERVYKLEKHEAVVDEEIKVANHRISDLEHFHK